MTGGTVSGLAESGLSIFKGIPFAAPPIGDRRWKAPAPVAPWSGVRRPMRFAKACMQAPNTQGNTAPVSEDCLYLNVWTPAKAAGAKLPVIVWIHGGGYVGGSTSIGMYDGTGFAKKGVVLVSLAYRLGPYGFMAHPELSREGGKGSGTYGIQDLVAGLQWVRANVAAFGGDPGNVTIFGHSAGAGAVRFLSASPAGEGPCSRKSSPLSGGSFTAVADVGAGRVRDDDPDARPRRILRHRVPHEARREEHRLRLANWTRARLQAAAGAGPRRSGGGWLRAGERSQHPVSPAGKFSDTPVLLGHTSDETLAFGGPKSLAPADFGRSVRGSVRRPEAVLGAYPRARRSSTL